MKTILKLYPTYSHIIEGFEKDRRELDDSEEEYSCIYGKKLYTCDNSIEIYYSVNDHTIWDISGNRINEVQCYECSIPQDILNSCIYGMMEPDYGN